MYFIPRNNKIYSFLITSPTHMWYLLTVGVIACLSISWWAAWYMPNQATLARMRIEYNELIQQQTLMSNVNKQVDQLSHTVDDLIKIIKNNMRDYDMHRIRVNTLLTFAIDSGLHLRQYKPGNEKQQDGFIIRQVELQLSGDFQSIEKFFKFLAQHDYPIHVEQLVISKGKTHLDVRR